MSRFRLSERSLHRLQGVHPDLVSVVKRAIAVTEIDFGVTEGLRNIERQRQLVALKASRTMRSRHLTGHAVDLVAYIGPRISWEWPLYEKIAEATHYAADELNVSITWGGEWKMRDGPHFQLSWQAYPA